MELMVNRGYKNTEIGVIPAEWNSIQIQTLLDQNVLTGHMDGNHGGLYPRSNEFTDHGVPYISANDFIKGDVNFNTCKFVSLERAKQFQKGFAQNGDVLFAHNATVGPVTLLKTKLPFVILSTTATYFRTNPKELINWYLVYALQAQSFVRQYTAVMAQSTRYQVPITTQRKFYIAMPPVEEQRAIANTLSNTDELIVGLENLIEKKRSIKQGVIQELLKPKTSWKQWQLGKVFQFLGTASNSRSELSNDGESGNIGYVHYGDIHTLWNNFIDFSKDILPTICKERVSKVPLLQDGDLIVADASEDHKGLGVCVEVRNLKGKKAVAGLHTLLLRGDKAVVADGFKGYMCEIRQYRQELARMATGISVYGISKNNLKNMDLMLPSIQEQNKIADVLFAMDAEIEALERKLDKYRKMKEGMMQILLTGKVRLI